MSDFKVYRNCKRFSCVTPKSPVSSPYVEYYTPTCEKKMTSSFVNSIGKLKKPEKLKTPRRLSADCFLQKERLKNKYRFYVRSPRTPLYKRCQVVKKKLIFDDEDDNIINTTNRQDHEITAQKNSDNLIKNHSYYKNIPKIVLISPNNGTKQSNLLCSDVSTFNEDDRSEFVLYPSETSGLTPNKMCIIQNICTSLDNHKVLGRGRYGCVVEEIYKGSKVAVKVIDISKKRLKGCLRSEHNGIGLDHPNVMKVYYILQPRHISIEHYALVVMEHMDKAMNLQVLLDSDYDDRFLTSQRIIRYTIHICEGLNYIHSKKILHLDVKPKNILVCPDEVCKLCDFGTSIYRGTKLQCDLKGLLYQFRGTVQYCAPEILCGLIPTRASDVYSLGITMWQLLHRTLPYGNTIREESLIYRVVKEDLRPVTSKQSSYFEKYYSDIYKTCWVRNMFERSNVYYILNKLYEYKHSSVPTWF